MKTHKILAIIPARGDSKGLKFKNLRKINGKTLIYYSVKAALGSKLIDRVIVSTDNRAIASEALKCGAHVPFLRPKKLATDHSSVGGTVRHAIEFLKRKEKITYDIIVLLQPTSPLRTVKHIDEAVRKLTKGRCTSVVSVTPVREHPYKMVSLRSNYISRFAYGKKRGIRRQDVKPFYKIDGSVYACYTKAFLKKGVFVTPKTKVIILDNKDSVDIDDEKDLVEAKALLRKRK